MPRIAWVDRKRVSKIAAYLRAHPPKTQALNFYSFPGRDGGPDIRAKDMYPELNVEFVLDFFFLVCLLDYGFWVGNEKGYQEPLFGQLGSSPKPRKGSDLLWRLFKRAFDVNPGIFAPQELADMRTAALSNILADAVGTQWPDFEHRLTLIRQWGQWLLAELRTPHNIVRVANMHERTLERFLEILRPSPFGRDPMMKKAVLLAMVLYNRPEHFLQVSEQDTWPAIVDYHLMRLNLRQGTVKVREDVAKLIEERVWVPPKIESAIREATRQAEEQMTEESGLTHGVMDNTKWQARGYCPEMTGPDWGNARPDCDNCLFEPVCEKLIERFQPVIRTDAY